MKCFQDENDWRNETAVYGKLSEALPVLPILHNEPKKLITQYLQFPTLLEELERQEENGFSAAPWDNLVKWLQRCKQVCQLLPSDGNLRNYLWDSKNERIIGLDFEGFILRTVEDCVADIIVFILSCRPENTKVKQEIGNWLSGVLDISEPMLANAQVVLNTRREKRRDIQQPTENMTGIILAGGASKRMGVPKADLRLFDHSFLECQVKKLQAVGIADVLISGTSFPEIDNTKAISDEYRDRGPLGGLHACLKKAKHKQCLVISVDAPLIPPVALLYLCRRHQRGITVLRHAGRQEPLIGVYDRSVAEAIPQLIEKSGAPVCALSRIVPWNFFDYLGPEELLNNCNTPQEYSKMLAIASEYRNCGLL